MLIQADKEFNLTCNYKKGDGDGYEHYKEVKHPGKRYLPIIRVTGGARQDAAFEGALPLYDGRADMLEYTDMCLESSDNRLKRCLFLSLSSMEVIAQLRVASILYLSVIIPLRLLAGNTHKLAKCNWGERSMGNAIDLLYNAFVKIQEDGSLLLDHDFMMNMFQPLHQKGKNDYSNF